MLSPEQLLHLVDACAPCSPAERGIRMWHAAQPDASVAALWAAPRGCQEHALLDLRVAVFGTALELVDACPACGEEIEFALDVSTLRLARPAMDNPSFVIQADGATVTLRLVSCADLAAVERGEITDRAGLLARCIMPGSGVEAASLSPAQCDAIDAVLAERDPQADVRFALTCPACAHGWSALFDVGAVVWSELRRQSLALLYEVDALARVYHWSEAEILALAPERRRRYLELVSG